MTHPHDPPRGCATDGKSHLNLTVTLEDAWKRDRLRRRLRELERPRVRITGTPAGWPAAKERT